jgi:hypothetical protein
VRIEHRIWRDLIGMALTALFMFTLGLLMLFS